MRRGLSRGAGIFSVVAVLEAFTYLTLIGASIAHRGFGTRNLVGILGLVHGTVFLLYLALSLRLRSIHRWDNGTMIVVVVASVVPFGTLMVERRIVDRLDKPDLLHGWLLRR